jgi:hypothetical protein
MYHSGMDTHKVFFAVQAEFFNGVEQRYIGGEF